MKRALLVVAAWSGQASADPACKATVGTNQEVFIAGKATGLTATTDPDKYKGSVVTYPFDATHILLAWTAPGHYGRPDGSELFLVDCKAPAKMKTFWKGDFGHSRMLPDGKTIVFSDGDARGIGLFDVTTKKAKGLTYPPAFKEGSAECEGREPGLHDIITDLDLDNDLLLFERGGSCGFEGDWDSSGYAIEHITTKPSKPRKGLPVPVIAAGAGNEVWAAKYACDAGTTAIAWSSTDLGATWTKHAVPKAATGIMAIFVDAKQAGHVSVVTGACKQGPMGFMMPVADRVHVTKDGGTTWQLAKLPSGNPDSVDLPDVESLDGSYDHLALWAPSDGGGDQMWTSSDAGANWKEAKVKPRKTLPTTVDVGGAKLSTSPDGIIVKPASGPSKRVYPYRTY